MLGMANLLGLFYANRKMTILYIYRTSSIGCTVNGVIFDLQMAYKYLALLKAFRQETVSNQTVFLARKR